MIINENNKEILEQFKIAMYINGKYNARRWRANSKLRKEIENTYFDEFETLDEKIWALRNDIPNRPACVVCGGKVKLRDQMTGFFKTCSKKCAANDIGRNIKIQNTSLARYGVNNYLKSQKYKTFCKEQKNILGYRPGAFNTPENKMSIIKKYGVDNVFQSNEIKNKIKLTNIKKYGVDNPQQNKQIREKTRNTQISRYGQDGFNPVKTKETLIQKYGVDNPLKSLQIRDKIKETCLERYGVEHPIQNPEIFEKIQRAQQQARYKYKEFIMPSCKILYCQGYEDKVLDYLIKAGIMEDDITNVRYDVPVIEYEFNGKCRKYFPDIFIKSKNLLIEVKSTYTFFKEHDKNMAKQFACKNMGYHHIIIIWDNKTNHIFEII